MSDTQKKITQLLDSIRPKDLIFEKYIVDGSPGRRGGEGVVYHVSETPSKIGHAIKIIPLDIRDGQASSRMMKQIDIWQKFNKQNANVIEIQGAEVGEVAGIECMYLLTSHSDLGSLGDFIETPNLYDNLSVSTFFDVALGLFKGFLAMANKHDSATADKKEDIFYHGDIKPQNAIMFRDDDQYIPKVIDFGISVSALDNATGISLPYAAPELINGAVQKVSLESEIYSLGVTFYEFLFGRLPYNVENARLTAIDNETLTRYNLAIQTSKVNYKLPKFELPDDLLNEFVKLIRVMIDADPKRRRKLSLRAIRTKLQNLKTKSEQFVVKVQKTSYIGRSRFVWNPKLHSVYDESEYFFLIKGRKFGQDTAVEIQKYLLDKEIHGYSMHLVYGPYDIIVRFWSKMDEEAIDAIANDFPDCEIHAVICSGRTRSIRLDRSAQKFDIARDRDIISDEIENAISSGNDRALISKGYALNRYDLNSKKIRVFTFVQIAPEQADASSTLFDGLFTMFDRKLSSSLLPSGTMHEVKASNGEAATRIVIEYEVSKYENVYDTLKYIIEYCSDSGLKCTFKSFMEVTANSVQLCDDGEFLSEIVG